jgi:DNA helicase-2/ATP-dependent DNA helicase PcrA
MSFKASIYQEAIFNHIKNSDKNAIIEAVAGSGKTTTLLESLKISNTDSVIFVAFNKHIAEELKPKVPKGVRVSTMHSFGYEQILRSYGKVKIDALKVKRTIQNKAKDLYLSFAENKNEYAEDLSNLVDLLRLNLCKDVDTASIISYKHSLMSTSQNLINDAFIVIQEMNRIRDSIDFVDMVYIPAIEDIKIRTYDLVLVDECQDLSKCQIQLMKKMKTEGGRIIAVGDRNQAIYGFGGADHESFENLTQMENTVLLPLSISYRCSKSVIREAQKIVPSIEYFENAIEGSINKTGNMMQIKDGDFVLCRMNAPLISSALRFIANGKKASVKGIDIGSRIIANIKSTKEINLKKAINILKYKYELAKREYEESTERKSKVKLITMEDMINATEILSIDCQSIEDVKKKITNLFSDTETQGVIFSSAHKAKGLEAKNVHIIKPEFMPLKSVFLDWEKEQEENLHYVAITRAKENLNYIPDIN